MINLLPDEIKKKRKRHKYKKISCLIIILILTCLVVTNSYVQNLANDYQQQIDKLDNQLNQLQVTKETVATTAELKGKIEARANLLSNLEDDLNYSWLIKDLKMIIPQQVGLEQLSIKQDKQLLVGGTASTNEKLLETVDLLEKYPYFMGVKIDSSQQQDDKINFVIRGRIKNSNEL
jgi:cell division protein ZapA (FtsZ GTPase activity inhibitor)